MSVAHIGKPGFPRFMHPMASSHTHVSCMLRRTLGTWQSRNTPTMPMKTTACKMKMQRTAEGFIGGSHKSHYRTVLFMRAEVSYHKKKTTISPNAWLMQIRTPFKTENEDLRDSNVHKLPCVFWQGGNAFVVHKPERILQSQSTCKTKSLAVSLCSSNIRL